MIEDRVATCSSHGKHSSNSIPMLAIRLQDYVGKPRPKVAQKDQNTKARLNPNNLIYKFMFIISFHENLQRRLRYCRIIVSGMNSKYMVIQDYTTDLSVSRYNK